MNPSREEALFVLALEKSADKRPAFLDAICEGDPALGMRRGFGNRAVRSRSNSGLMENSRKDCFAPLRAHRAMPHHQLVLQALLGCRNHRGQLLIWEVWMFNDR